MIAADAVTDPGVPLQSSAAAGLRILAFCDYFHPGTGGGAERVAFEVYRRLAAWGAEVVVVTTAGEPDGWKAGLRVVEVPAVDLTRRLGIQACITHGAARLASAVAAEVRPHVLHANSLQFQTSLTAARLQHRSGLPLVLTAHLGGFEALAQPLRTLASLHERTVGRYVLSRSRRVIAVSEAVAHHLRRVGVDDRVRVVPNGVEVDRFHPVGPGQTGGTEAGVHIVFVGRLVPNKGPALLLEAFARLRRDVGLSARLTMVGDGPMRSALEGRARALGLNGAVRLVGHSDRVEDVLRDAHIFVRPTLTEGMPLAVLEAMAARVCVVASDVPGNAGLIRHGETGLLFPAGDEPALAAVLHQMVADRAGRERLAQAGHLAARAYSWDRCARQTLDVLVEAVPVRGRRGGG